MEIEPEMLAMETIVPVYFAVEDEALLSIYEQTQAASASQGSASAAEGVGGCRSRAGSWGAFPVEVQGHTVPLLKPLACYPFLTVQVTRPCPGPAVSQSQGEGPGLCILLAPPYPTTDFQANESFENY